MERGREREIKRERESERERERERERESINSAESWPKSPIIHSFFCIGCVIVSFV